MSKDVKHNPVLPKSMLRYAATPVAQSGRDTDEKKSLSTETSSPSQDVLDEIKRSLRIDISKIDPKDTELVKAVQQQIVGILSVRNGIAGDLKHFYQDLINYNLFPATFTQTPMAAGNGLATAPLITAPGWSVNELIASGNTISTRIGRKIKLKHLTIRLNVTWFRITNSAADVQEGFLPFRMIVFRDKQTLAPPSINAPSGSATTSNVQAVLLNLDLAAAGYEGVTAPFNPTTKGFRYDILSDEYCNPPGNAVINYNQVTGNNQMCASKAFKFHVPVDGIVCDFADDSTNPATTVIVTNLISIMFATNSLIVNGAFPAIDYSQDLTFVDA